MRILSLLLLCGGLMGCSEHEPPADIHKLEQKLLHLHIRMGHYAFENDTADMYTHLAEYCAQPDAAQLPDLQQSFRRSLQRWMAIQHIHFGPVTFAGRAQRIHFWPDPDDMTDKWLSQTLRHRPEQFTDPAQLAGTNPALQGFPALEMLLFDNHQVLEGYACRLALAISANLHSMAAHMDDTWDSMDTHNEGELSALMLSGISTQLTLIYEQKIMPVLGTSDLGPRPDRAENWRSGQSSLNILTHLQAMGEAFLTALMPQLEQTDPVTARMTFSAFATASQTAEQLALPLSDVVTDHRHRAQLETLAVQIQALNDLIRKQVAPALDISLFPTAGDRRLSVRGLRNFQAPTLWSHQDAR